jgi:L-rhamnose-H+ transport protein
MTIDPLLGLSIVILAGALNGSFALPMKGTPRWAFENTWLVYSVVGMLVLNWGIALYTVPGLTEVFRRAGPEPVLMVIGFGMVWGLANLLFGTGIHLIGISLAFPITLGLSTAFGSLLPMAQDPQVFLTPAGMTICGGVAVLLVGVYVCGLAGIRKDVQASLPSTSPAGTASKGSNRLIKGLLIVVLAGFFDPFLNFAFTFGDRIKLEALASGAGQGAESDAIWALALLGSFVVNVLFCTYELTRNKTWRRFREPGTSRYWLLACLMAVIWMASITMYGRGATAMGPLGGSVGWALFLCSIIIFSTLWGVVSGEWKGGGRPLVTMYAGLAVLMVAIVILGYGVSLPST